MQTAVELLESFLSNISSFFDIVVEWVQYMISIIVVNPALLVLVIAMPIVGFAVGLLSRLIRA